MEFITFTNEAKTNISDIDNQHEQMTLIVNRMHNAFVKNENDTVITHLRILADNLKSHFIYEEDLMLKTKYHGYYSHKLEHDRFHRKVEKILKSQIENKAGVTLEVLQSIRNWFFNHIEINDKKIGVYFEKKGLI